MSAIPLRWLAAGIAAALSVVALQVSLTSVTVLVPLVVMVGLTLAFLVFEWLRNGNRAPVSIGTLYVSVIAVYAVYPLLVYLALDGFYTPFNDSRLAAGQPGPEVVSHLAWYYAAYVSSFMAGYFVGRPLSTLRAALAVTKTDSSVLWAVLLVFVSLRAVVFVADFLFAAPSQDYLSSYLRYSELPMLAQQLLGHANGMLSVLGIALIAAACLNWHRSRWLVIAWLALEAIELAVGLGSRIGFVLLVLALVTSYHFLVRPISMRRLTLGAIALIAAFLSVGIMRAYSMGGAFGTGLELLGSASEFESLFANAFDIEQLLAAGQVNRAGITVPVYLGDIVALVPQQLMPFEKVNLARWYVETFHQSYAETGGGLAFGAIAESLVGLGPIDLLWRGAAAGLFFGWVDGWARKRSLSIWRFTLYVWILAQCYVTFRASTLALLPLFVYRFVPILLIVSALAELIRIAGRSRHVVDDCNDPSRETSPRLTDTGSLR